MERLNSNPNRSNEGGWVEAKAYLADLAALNAQIADVAGKLANAPGDLKVAYENVLEGLKSDKEKLLVENKVVPQPTKH